MRMAAYLGIYWWLSPEGITHVNTKCRCISMSTLTHHKPILLLQVVDLSTGMSIEAKRTIEELQKRINVLERQNAQLKRTVQTEDAASPPRRPASPARRPGYVTKIS